MLRYIKDLLEFQFHGQDNKRAMQTIHKYQLGKQLVHMVFLCRRLWKIDELLQNIQLNWFT